MSRKIIDIKNQTFGKLTVLGQIGSDIKKNILWECQCECGNKRICISNALRSGWATSCGCGLSEIAKKRATTHGKSNTKEFRIWWAMKDRCYRESDKHYKDYGGRSIKVCERWKDSFRNFLDDMGEKPIAHSIERKNNNEDYYPENCHWIPLAKQAANTRKNKYVIWHGNKIHLEEFYRSIDVSRNRIRYLIEDKGISPIEAAFMLKYEVAA